MAKPKMELVQLSVSQVVKLLTDATLVSIRAGKATFTLEKNTRGGPKTTTYHINLLPMMAMVEKVGTQDVATDPEDPAPEDPPTANKTSEEASLEPEAEAGAQAQEAESGSSEEGEQPEEATAPEYTPVPPARPAPPKKPQPKRRRRAAEKPPEKAKTGSTPWGDGGSFVM